MWTQKPSFRFEINNILQKKSIFSETFVSGGCEWYLKTYPKIETLAGNHLSSYLWVANSNSLRTGWKRSAQLMFVMLNQSGKVLYRTASEVKSYLFCPGSLGWGCLKALYLSKLQEEGSLENDKLIIEVYINVVEAVDGEGEEDVLKKNETVEINGFQVLASQVTSVRKLFAEHPNIAEDFKLNNKAVKTTYMNVLLKLIRKLEKPPKSLSETKLTKASSKLSELMDVGFKLGWLKSKLDERIKNLKLIEMGSLKSKLEELSLKMKKVEDADGSRVEQLEERFTTLEHIMKKAEDADKSRDQQLEERFTNLERMMKITQVSDKFRIHELEERIKNLEQMETGFKVEILETMFGKVSLEMKKENSRTQQLEERLKNIEQMETGLKFEYMRTKLENISLERKKIYDAYGSCVQKLAERVKNLEVMKLDLKLDYLKSMLEEDSLERKKTKDADRSRIEQVEVRINEVEFEYGFQLECLMSKFEDDSLERKKTHDADVSRIQELEDYLEDNVENLELMVSYLKDELDKKKDKSFADGFMLVD